MIKISEEHSDHKWITIGEAKDYFEYEDVIEILKRAEKVLHET